MISVQALVAAIFRDRFQKGVCLLCLITAGCRIGYDQLDLRSQLGGSNGGVSFGGGTGGNSIGANGGVDSSFGGDAGTSSSLGGAAGTSSSLGGAAGTSSSLGGAAGTSSSLGGAAGTSSSLGGAGAASGGAGGDAGNAGSLSGAGTSGAAGTGATGGASGNAGTGGTAGAGGSVSCSAPSGCSCQSFASHEYWFCSALVNQASAATTCVGGGMSLVRIDDSAENDWLLTTALSLGMISSTGIPADLLFTGADDQAVADTWQWADGTVFWSGGSSGSAVGGLYANWASSNPQTSTTRRCAGMFYTGSWQSRSCTALQPYVCESAP